VWVRQDYGIAETGQAYGPGLMELGFAPEHLALVRLRTAMEVLRAGVEAARCPGVGVVVLELSDAGHKADLTATRRLKLAAETSGATLFLVRGLRHSTASGAQTRWLVRPAVALNVSEPGPGWPRYEITLLRHRAGVAERRWQVEWNRDRRAFEPALSEPVVAVPCGRPMAA
jgi:protein ImuA